MRGDHYDRTHRTRRTDPRSTAHRRDRHDRAEPPREPTTTTERPTPRADGGDEVDLPERGERVRDRNTDDELLVLEADAETRADEHAIDALDGVTVAEANPEYDPTAPVVQAVYAESAAERLNHWRTVEDLVDAVAFDALEAYTFPADRLAPLEDADADREEVTQ